jgi:hypothetical protein
MRAVIMNIIAFRSNLFEFMCNDLLHAPASINLWNTNSLNTHKALNTYSLLGSLNINGIGKEHGLKENEPQICYLFWHKSLQNYTWANGTS